MSEIRRALAGCVKYRERRRGWGPRYRLIGVNPLPAQRAATNGWGRLATGLHVLTADELLYVFNLRLPRRLAGDYRTARSPAMRPENWRPFEGVIDRGGHAPLKRGKPLREKKRQGFRYRVTRRRPVLPYLDFGIEANPNKGAARTKKIGIYSDWFQPLRIEKWDVPGGWSPRHKWYRLVCPGNPATPGSLRYGKVQPEQPRVMKFDPWEFPGLSVAEKWKLAKEDWRFPPLSTAPTCVPRPQCRQRAQKLFMVMCTKAEMRDAEIAQKWIESLPPRVYASQLPFIGRLRERYGMLFSPRTLLCERCLDLKYGVHPDTALRKNRRARGKALPA